MSWSDLFYPGNPGRRTKVVRLCTQLHTLMDNNFKSANTLIDIINKYIPGKNFQKIYFQDESDIKTNVDIMVNRMQEIQDYVELKKEELRAKLEPKIYAELVSTDTNFKAKFDAAKKLSTTAIATIGSVVGAFVVGGIYQESILVTVISKIGLIRTVALATLVLSVLVLGVDMIASAIIGAVERDKLDHAIDELEKTIETFEPGSREFDRSILRVLVYIEELFVN